MSETVSRRRFLNGTALAGAGAAALLAAGSRPAAAFSVQPMNAKTHALYASACGGAGTEAYHKALVQQVTAQLEGRMSQAEVEATLASLTCPICGCPLAGLI